MSNIAVVARAGLPVSVSGLVWDIDSLDAMVWSFRAGRGPREICLGDRKRQIIRLWREGGRILCEWAEEQEQGEGQ